MGLRQEFNNLDIQGYAAKHPALFAYVKEQMAAPGKQYLLLGDTHHEDKYLQDFLFSPLMAALIKHASIHAVCLEAPREIIRAENIAAYRAALNKHTAPPKDLATAERNFWQNMMADQELWAKQVEIAGDSTACRRRQDMIELIKRQLDQKSITPSLAEKKLRDIQNHVISGKNDFWGDRLLGFTQAALTVHAVDSIQWRPSLVPSLTERIFLGDREVTDYIKAQTGNEKTAVIYGSGHLNYDGAMTGHLGRESCLLVQIYSNRNTYKYLNSSFNLHADFMPDKVYLVEEDLIESPAPELFQGHKDRYPDRFQELKEIAMQTYGENADAKIKAKARANITMLRSTDKEYFDYKPARHTNDNNLKRPGEPKALQR